MCASALPRKSKPGKICIKINQKSINLISTDLWAPAVGQIQFLTVVQQCNVRMMINWRSDWYSLDWSGAEHLINTDANEWRKRVVAHIH